MANSVFGCERNITGVRPAISFFLIVAVSWAVASPRFAALEVFHSMGRAEPLAGAEEAEDDRLEHIEHIDLVHFTHTDFGYTDHPFVCRELQKRYLDIAIDSVLATRDDPDEHKFCWTAEGTVAVRDWWEAASPERRADLLAAVESGQLDVSALPFNQTPTLNERQWEHMLHWLPEDLWQKVEPQVALQNDVNGMPRAGAVALLDRGVRYLLTSINATLGGAPFQRPSAFWWKMPDGRRMLVWLNYSYPQGFYFFHPETWRRGPVPEATDTRYRPPRPGDFLCTDEESLRAAHRHLLGRLRALEEAGYVYPTLLISMTNEWRMDNDPPFPPLADFVAAWRRAGLKPTLRLTTVSAAMRRLEKQIGDHIPEHEGEWTDWWANGVTSGPREVAASRWAKRLVHAAESDLWGELSPGAERTIRDIYDDLCLFDEHTWGYSYSIAFPYCLESIGHYNEKSRYAYRAMARAKWLLSQRVRARLAQQPEGLYVGNPSELPFAGWITLPVTCLRDDYQSVEDPQSNTRIPLEFRPGLKPYGRPQSESVLTRANTAATFPDNVPKQLARFWLDGLEGGTIRKLHLSTEAADAPRPETSGPRVELDQDGWPAGARWDKMQQPLFLPGLGDFISVSVRGFAPRWIYMDLMGIGDGAAREKARQEHLIQTTAVPEGEVSVEKNAHTIVYTQALQHPRLRWATRILELWNRQPRVRFTLRLNRRSHEDPEVYFVAFPLPCKDAPPRTSNGGLPLVPFQDQLPGTCRDYFSIDGWVHYGTEQGHWLWVSRDAPLVTFGEPQVAARRTSPPHVTHRILAMIFDNTWFTNFVANSHGVMEFQFDLVWKEKGQGAASIDELAKSLEVEPTVMINPALAEMPVFMDRLYRP